MFFKYFINFINVSVGLSMSCNIFSVKDCYLKSQVKNKFCTKPELADVWPSTKIIQIMFCNITELGTELFKNYHFTTIYIINNKISVIHSYTFTDLNIVSLTLTNNNIEVLELNAFHELNVSDLDLSGNKLNKLNPTAFINVRFDYFRINYNPIMSIRENDLNFLNRRRIKRISMLNCTLTHFEPRCFINKSIDKFDISHYSMSLIKTVCENNYRINNILEMCDKNDILITQVMVWYVIPSSLVIIGFPVYLILRIRRNNLVSPII